MNKKKADEPGLRFPPDMAALLGFYFIFLPVAAMGSSVFIGLINARNSGDTTLLWTAIALGAIGTVLLFFAKLPLYRERRYLQIGPRGLAHGHRRLYWWAWFFVAVSIILLTLLAILVR